MINTCFFTTVLAEKKNKDSEENYQYQNKWIPSKLNVDKQVKKVYSIGYEKKVTGVRYWQKKSLTGS